MAKCTFGAAVLAYCIIAIIVHCLFIAYVFINRPITCVNGDRDGINLPNSFEFEFFLIWAIVYFPFLLFCAFYTLLFRMSRSFLCSCWECCGNDIHAKGATKCKICFEGVFGNPLIFAIIFIIWGVYEWISFGTGCLFEIQWGFLGDLIVVSISLLLLCIYYFVRVKSRFEKKRNANIAKKYHDQQREDAGFDEGGGDVELNEMAAGHIQNNHPVPDRSPQQQGYMIQAPPKRMSRLQMQREGSGQRQPHQPNRRFSAQPQMRAKGAGLSPAYAASAQGVAPYQPDPRRHSYQPNARGNIPRNASPFQSPQNGVAPAYAASAHGASPYRPGQQGGRRHSYNPNQASSFNDNPLIENSPGISYAGHQKQESMSIEISVDLGGDDDEPEVIAGPRTRGPSLSWDNKYKGHARRVSSGILNILKKIDAEPECAVCMGELEKGDEMGQLPCGHTFHKECIVEWLGNEPSCPMCRVDMKK